VAPAMRMRMRGVVSPSTLVEAEPLLSKGPVVVNFWAAWAEPCEMMNAVFAELSAEYHHLTFVQIDADAVPELCDRFNVESVPAFLFLQAGALIDSVMGADAPTLANKVKQQDLSASIAAPASVLPPVPPVGTPAPPAKPPPLEERLRALTHQAPVMLFMKGTADAPRCGFSRQAIEMLQQDGISFSTFDILGDEEVRQGLKKFSNWPTYPQLYGDGKLVGGLDIMKELQEEGELASSLPAAK